MSELTLQQSSDGTVEISQLASEISARIAQLSSLFEAPLKNEMEALKVTLIANPSAAALLKDEDVGTLVANLRRTVSVAIQEANKPKEKKTSSKKNAPLTKEQLQAALDEGFPE